jgi:hypothetical protein
MLAHWSLDSCLSVSFRTLVRLLTVLPQPIYAVIYCTQALIKRFDCISKSSVWALDEFPDFTLGQVLNLQLLHFLDLILRGLTWDIHFADSLNKVVKLLVTFVLIVLLFWA